MPRHNTFPKSGRLLANRQFRAVYARRLSARDELLVVHACENDFGRPRIGISIGKSCGTAVVRNRLKRLLREAFRQNKRLIPTGFDYVVSMSYKFRSQTQEEAKQPTFEQIRDSFIALAARVAGPGA